METKLSKLRNFLSQSGNTNETGDSVKPQVGFKVFFNEVTKQLKVKVIGARQLPTDYGNVKPLGYLVKIRVFPERDKYETSTAKESWPMFNEEFSFTLHSANGDYFKGKFVSLTVYAVISPDEELKTKSTNGVLKRLMSFIERAQQDNDSVTLRRHNSVKDKDRVRRRSSRLGSRRTVGAVTYDLGKGMFTQRLPDDCTIVTPDIWRDIKVISSGMQTEPREGKKGNVEVTLSYALSEDSNNDVIEVSVTKFRCSMQTMQEHEKLGGQMYIKITAFENEDTVQKMKSDRFDPTISLRIETNTATLRAAVNEDSLKRMKILIRLMNKNIVGKKTLLGKIEIDRSSDIWKEMIEIPSCPVTKMLPFE